MYTVRSNKICFTVLCSIVFIGCMMMNTVTAQNENGSHSTGEGDEGGGGFPGIQKLAAVLKPDGGLAMQLLNSCDPENKLSDQCTAELKKVPPYIQQLTTTFDLTGVDIAPMCDACKDDHIIEYLDNIRKNYKEEDADPTCDGTLSEIIAPDTVFQLVKIFFTAACIKDDNDKYCFDVLPPAMEKTGFTKIISQIDFNDIGGMTGLMASVASDFGTICEGLSEGGCCSGMMTEIMTAMADLICLDSPMIKQGMTMMGTMCQGDNKVPDTCSSFNMPEIDNPSECPNVREFAEKIENTKAIADSKYKDCKIDSCPKNDCELFICQQGDAAVGGEDDAVGGEDDAAGGEDDAAGGEDEAAGN